MNFDYYYGSQSENFAFYRIPRAIVTGAAFRRLSMEAKLLYGLLLDRMGLSMRNEWYDDQGRVFIYYTLDEIKEDMNCGHDKAVRLLAELDTAKGIGLIERVKQGQGRPTIIYVKQFTTPDVPGGEKCVHSRLPKIGSADFGKSEVKTSGKPNSRLRESRSADFGFSDANYNNINQSEMNHTYPSYTDPSIHPHTPTGGGMMDRNDVMEQVKEQVDYMGLIAHSPPHEVDSLLDLITDTLCTTTPYIRIGGSELTAETVKQRFRSLDASHIEYVIDAMQENNTKIRNIRAYLLTALYNAPVTIDPYYSAAVRHDLG